jgi:dsDNA-binding SOS-regulon protein
MSNTTSKSSNKDNKEINIPEGTILITKTQFEQLKKSGEISTFTWLNTLDEYDELLGNSLNLDKTFLDEILNNRSHSMTEDEVKALNLFKDMFNHTIQIFLRRHNIKMQIAARFNTSVQETNGEPQQQQT